MEIPNVTTLDFAQQLQKEGKLCLSRGDCYRAEHLYSQAHQIILAKLGPLHRLVADSLLNMGTVNCSLGNNQQARKLFGDAFKIAITTIPVDSPVCINANISLANSYIIEDKFVEAETILTTFLNKLLNQTKTNFHAVAVIRSELAHLYAKNRRKKIALIEIDCIRKSYDHLLQDLSSRSHREQLAGIEHARLAYFYALSLILQYFKDSAIAAEAMLLYTFRRKALQMEFERTRQQILSQSAKDSKSTRLKELDRVREKLTKSTMSFTVNSENNDIHYRKLQNDESQRQELEESLTRVTLKSSVINRLNSLNLPDFDKTLSEDETLIEFVKYRHYAFSGLKNVDNGRWLEYRYLAIIFETDPIRVQLVDLGNSTDIDRMVKTFRTETSKKFNYPNRGLIADDESVPNTVHNSGITLRQRIFDPLVRNCEKGSRLIIVPDSDLWSIPFGALPSNDRNSYLSDRYDISYLNSGRDLIKPQNVTEKLPSRPLVVAAPGCNKKAFKWLKLLSLLTNLTKISLLMVGKEKSVDTSKNNSIPFEQLSGAEAEVEIVANLLSVPVQHWLKARKTLFQQITSPRILHFAAHGWYFPHEDRSIPKMDSCEKLFSRYTPINNPMLRSAILLSNSQHYRSIPLSAEQVLGLNLQSTELVVLSACDSGLGEIKVGEGVFGLRRAFMLAGAKAVIISLWQVADLPTTLLMAQFYMNLTRKHQSIDDSLRNAQKYLKKTSTSELCTNSLIAKIIENICSKDPRVQKTVDWYHQQPPSFRPFEDPYYWGGFVIVGKSM